MSKPCVLVTGGPTRAYLDRVRFLSNVSTGALAFELCRTLQEQGFDVVLVSGPSSLPFGDLKLRRWVPVETNEEMLRAVVRVCREDKPFLGVFAAAVLDFVPARRAEGKRPSQGDWPVRFVPAPKILDEVGRRFPRLERIAFKLEWKATSKASEAKLVEKYLRRKSLAGFCVNYLSQLGPASHPATFYTADGEAVACTTKRDLAAVITGYASKLAAPVGKLRSPKRKPSMPLPSPSRSRAYRANLL